MIGRKCPKGKCPTFIESACHLNYVPFWTWAWASFLTNFQAAFLSSLECVYFVALLKKEVYFLAIWHLPPYSSKVCPIATLLATKPCVWMTLEIPGGLLTKKSVIISISWARKVGEKCGSETQSKICVRSLDFDKVSIPSKLIVAKSSRVHFG